LVLTKNTKAQDILAKRKADAAKATLPPLAEKSTKLLKVNETLARRKAEAVKVTAAEKEKKKVHDPSPAADTDKKMASKKRPSEATERGKRVTIKEKGPDDDEPSGKRARADPVAETDEDVDILSTPQIQPCTIYPPKGSARKLTEEPSSAGLADPEELEARKVRGKRVAEMIQKKIAMAGAAPKEHCRTRGCLPLSKFTTFGLFFDNAHSFPAQNRFVFMALGVACDNVFTKNWRLRCLV
jgi:hypothetical protein